MLKKTNFLKLIVTALMLFIAFTLGRLSYTDTSEKNKVIPKEQQETEKTWFSFSWSALENSNQFKQHPFLKPYFNAEGLLENTSKGTFPLMNFIDLEKYCAKATSLKGNKGKYDDGALYCEEANYYSVAKEIELVTVNPEIFFNDASIVKIELITSEHFCMIGEQYEISTNSEVVKRLNNIPIEASLPVIYNYQLRPKVVNQDDCPRYDSESANYIATDLVFYHDDKNKIVFSVDFDQDSFDQYGFLRIHVYDAYRSDNRSGAGYFLINLQEYKSLLQYIIEMASKES